jgi:hypothetical protein
MSAPAQTATGPGQDDCADICIATSLLHCVLEIEMHLPRPGVELLRPVQGDGAEAIRDLAQDRFIGHGASSPVHFCRSHDA